jgi:hypothetical protein
MADVRNSAMPKLTDWSSFMSRQNVKYLTAQPGDCFRGNKTEYLAADEKEH